MTIHVFEYGVGGHYWAGILDLNVKMVSQHGKNLFIESGIPNLVGKVASFAFLSHLVQEISLLIVFNMALAAILSRHFKTWKSIQTQNIMNTILLDLQSQN